MTNQPSKESLERAQILVVNVLTHVRYPVDRPESTELREVMAERVALEFDAMKEESVASEVLRVTGDELIKSHEALRQQNTALVSALEDMRDMVFDLPSGVDVTASENDLSPQDASAHIGGLIVQRINAALAPYAPAETKEKL